MARKGRRPEKEDEEEEEEEVEVARVSVILCLSLRCALMLLVLPSFRDTFCVERGQPATSHHAKSGLDGDLGK